MKTPWFRTSISRCALLARPGKWARWGIAAVLVVAGPRRAGASPVVILDPGHGGYDNGAAVSRVYEKHLNLDLAYRVATYLRRAGRSVQLTRDSDQFLSLGQRTQLADRYMSAVVVSLHFNWTGNTQIRGIETYHAGGVQSSVLAGSIQRSLVRACGAPDRGVRQRHFYVVRATRHPAVLVEGGYLSNPVERRLCCLSIHRDRIARGIAEGILRVVR